MKTPVPVPGHAKSAGAFSPLQAQKEATFGMGCFWKPSEELLKVDGVIDTVVGYTGVSNYDGPPPTYEKVCFSRDAWVEGVRVVYDDTQVSYNQLLNAFFEAQEPKTGSRQYASVVFAHDPTQEQMAQQWLTENSQRIRNDGVPATFTKIEPLSPFFRAENYHQEYWQKTRPRIAGMIGLMAIGSGVLDQYTPIVGWQSQIHTIANAIVFAGFLYILVERYVDTKVIQL
eukprot:CAMPEP_0198151114 /NCGR_PEP_ID=MMETSP1443-20131203/54306_1 /TAXON_ID=186043 /ORGANISM="Entomoneis sp., Strain CCMP2396" /LENGTH=228 /DNA_ID=CAMNT_0043816683 /DNA_START=154 /DNA_END=840 /DNA_ORIENTATION=+